MLQTHGQGAASYLHERGRAAWKAAVEHPMVREIGAGTLPHATFRRYFEQNILYLQDYARALGLLLSKAPDGQAMDTLGRFLGRIVQEEIPANSRFFERLGGDPGSLDAVSDMSDVTYGYTRHLLAVAALGDCAEGLAAVLPCQWSYGELARPLARLLPQDPIYAEWIAMFGNDAYDRLVEDSTDLLDRLAAPDSAERMRRLSWVFDRSTRYEVQFWDYAYGRPG
jgi:thiaminase/transcriptional activator TenA